MEIFFGILTQAVESTPIVASGAAIIWGILSIILSPCHLASIPLIIGFIDGQGRVPTRRAFLLSTLFAVGILISIALIGGITAVLGRMMGDLGAWGNYLVAALFFVIGLHLLEVITLPLGSPAGIKSRRKGLAAAFVLGLVFGIALGPCTFAYMAPMLAITFRVATNSMWYGIFLILMYGLGHCSVIVIAGSSTKLVQRFLNWNKRSDSSVILKRVCGGLVIFGGLYLIYAAP